MSKVHSLEQIQFNSSNWGGTESHPYKLCKTSELCKVLCQSSWVTLEETLSGRSLCRCFLCLASAWLTALPPRLGSGVHTEYYLSLTDLNPKEPLPQVSPHLPAFSKSFIECWPWGLAGWGIPKPKGRPERPKKCMGAT